MKLPVRGKMLSSAIRTVITTTLFISVYHTAGLEVITPQETISFNELISDGKIIDEDFKYDKLQSCGESGQECQLIGHLLLFPDEYIHAIHLFRQGTSESRDELRDSINNHFMILDNGIDSDGDPQGGAGNGKIHEYELGNRVYGTFTTWFYELDQKWREERDTDHDGLITFDELNAELDDKSRSRFDAADGKRDGWLSSGDISKFRHPIWHSSMESWAIAAFFHDLDQNRDQQITEAEFLRVPDETEETFLSDEAHLPKYVLEFEFKKLDVDGNGVLDYKEMQKLPDHRRRSMITHGVFSLLDALDTNSDRAIEQEELEAASEKLFGEADINFVDTFGQFQQDVNTENLYAEHENKDEL